MSMNKFGAFASVAVLLSVTACSSTGGRGAVGDNADMLKQLEDRQAALAAQEAQLDAREAALAKRDNTMPVSGASGEDLLPPNASAGQCFTRVWMPPQYKTTEERKLISEASERIEVTPAKYGKVKRNPQSW